MTSTWHSRADWHARDRKPHATFDPKKVNGVVIHWPGSKVPVAAADGKASAVAETLRGEQAYHMDVRHYSDIAYNYALDQSGGIWECRGLLIESGANDEVNGTNHTRVAITCLLNAGEAPTPELLAAGRDLIARVRETYPLAELISPHSSVSHDGTACPGPALRAHIADFEPGHDPAPTPGDDMTPAEFLAIKIDDDLHPGQQTSLGTLLKTLRREVHALTKVTPDAVAAAVVEALPAGTDGALVEAAVRKVFADAGDGA